MGVGVGDHVHETSAWQQPRLPSPEQHVDYEFCVVNYPGHYSPGARYFPKTEWCDFTVDVSQAIAAVKVVVQVCDRSGRAQAVEIPMSQVEKGVSAWTSGSTNVAESQRWAISVKGVKPGGLYAYRLVDHQGHEIAPHVSDPFALAATQFKWRDGDYIGAVRDEIRFLREQGKTDRDIFEMWRDRRVGDLAVPDSIPRPVIFQDFTPPWSIVIDTSQLLDPKLVSTPQPHRHGEREIIKLHPWHSKGAPAGVISADFEHTRGHMECLLDRNYRNWLKRFGNTIEFFPLSPSVTEPELVALGKENAWGYMPAQQCGVNPGYFISKDPHEQLKVSQQVMYECKRDGISVICDVVNGHVAETRIGPDYSLRLLDESGYFLFDREGREHDLTGCGNTLNSNSLPALELQLAQVRFYRDVLGAGCRIDQAATSGYDPFHQSDREIFNPNNPAFRRIVSESTNAILELMHYRGHFSRDIPEDLGAQTKDFWLGNLQRAEAYLEGMWPGSNPLEWRAFIASGSCGGIHPQQQLGPWSRNNGVQVFSHDGETVFDRARWAAVWSVVDRINGDQQLDELLTRLQDAPADYDALYREKQPRHARMSELVDYLRSRYPNEFEEAQGATHRWFLTQLYTTPGDILLVAGDHMRRTQDGDPNAYHQHSYLFNALASPPEASKFNNVWNSSLLTHRLHQLRDRHAAVFRNVNIVNGENPSSSAPDVVLDLSWYRADGRPMEGVDWSRSPVQGRLQLGWIYDVLTLHDRSLRDRLFFFDSSKAVELTVPDPGAGRVWRVFVDSTRALFAQNNDRYAQGDTYSLRTCGSVVMESVPAAKG